MSSLWIAIAAVSAIALISGLILGFAARRFQVEADPIVERIDALLPQSQCGQCGYPGCRPYAEAIVEGEKINRCAPGGEAVMRNIAALLAVDPQPLEGGAAQATPPRQVALIDEHNCIGCTKCIQACPVDAIVGATRALHTVISAQCTGCGLCLDPCPTACIQLIPVRTSTANWKWDLHTIPVQILEVKPHV
ncbi:electron transport complex subunit RsxB [Edwardsiella hoshinae]|uniref:Ion-translocating oxidoreductase complex subunit B n=1 Tax=Edwardsiella hoshinae TaxID=93378 RepID=A0A376DEL0_9GAMM|nr:electron transport complex subunit RsxB [Edwardsiella hoshinae]AOV96928.1 electron transport complex subunit RsxB [Edwardsiella hoshinae]QPR27215.1 electron transport complex subunit RsxB [Edwardsiella hoshinae]STC88115.1 Nitrogen fixation protein rnfB [Edwardsiella hoshinae]